MIPHKFTALEKELLANNQRWTVEDWEDVYLTIQQLKLRIVRRMQQRQKNFKRRIRGEKGGM